MSDNDSPNPYQVTFQEDETPVVSLGDIRFIRRKPMPCKVTGSLIRRVTWYTFFGKFWYFIGFGLLQVIMGGASVLAGYVAGHILLAIAYFTVGASHLSAELDFFLVLLFLAVFLFFEFIGYSIVASGTMRFIQDNKIIFREQSAKNTKRMLTVWCNCFCYGLICLLMLLPVWVMLIASVIGQEIFRNVSPSNFWRAIFCAGLGLFVVLGMFVVGRYAIGLHYIIDRNVGCLTALRRTANFTRGNGFHIAVSFLMHCVILVVISIVVFTSGVAIVENTFMVGGGWHPPILILGFFASVLGVSMTIVCAYLHCWLAVTYHLTTGQYDNPAAPINDDW